MNIPTSTSIYPKAKWVAKQIDEDFDYVYDVLMGNITGPSQFVAQVEATAQEYDELYATGVARHSLGAKA